MMQTFTAPHHEWDGEQNRWKNAPIKIWIYQSPKMIFYNEITYGTDVIKGILLQAGYYWVN